ncbi:Hypothetical protein PHPALM_18149 [Phytophthora palmivora]|uniref:Protein kintoun n=1 Tax=Phytophthora palmivora TaxID=4796 RepID=A0A2P4XKG5_9STRA|nr:Hypothetical protein PHPALM_18149 [Phytophthora palmivora]
MEKDAPSEAEMGALFEAAMRSQKSGTEPKVTPQEQQKFLSAMKDPEFRSLLNEYMQEISDPRNRAETEQYLTQLENEQKVPTDKQLVKPKPGFVVKTKWESTQKVFVNVCSSDKMQPPSSTRVMTGQQGTSWNLPYSLGPERLESDKGGSGVPTFDVCFHPRVVEFAMARTDYRHMVISTCLDAVEPILRKSRRKPNAVLVRNYHILKGVFYKSGDPVTMCLRKEQEDPEPKKAQSTPNVQATSKNSADKFTVLSDKENTPPAQVIQPLKNTANDSVVNQLTHVETEESSTLMKEVSSIKLDSKQKLENPQQKKMEHQLIYRGRFELLHHMQADPSKNVPEDRYRPKELVVEVSFPLSSSAKGLDLEVSERMLRLSADRTVPGNYEPLNLVLPFPVIENKGSAKFDRKNHKLVVTLPVQPPPKPKPQSISLIVQDDEEEEEEKVEGKLQNELAPSVDNKVHVPKQKKQGDDEFRMLRETALMVANDPQMLARTQLQAQLQNSSPVTYSSPVVTEPAAIEDDIFADLPPLENCGDDENGLDTGIDGGGNFASSTVSDQPLETKKIVNPIEPPFETHYASRCLSYIVGVPNIDAASVKLTFPSATSMHLQFSDCDQVEYEMEAAVLPFEIDPLSAEFDVASENMAVIIQKKSTTKPPVLHTLPVDESAPPLVGARFQNQLLYELD